MKATKMKVRKRTPLAEARHQLGLAQDVASEVAGRLEDAQDELIDAQETLERYRQSSERNALRVARLEGYIERVHEIERQQPAVMAQKDSIGVLRDRIANGPEQQAQAILDALDSKPDLMNCIVSNGEPPCGFDRR